MKLGSAARCGGGRRQPVREGWRQTGAARGRQESPPVEKIRLACRHGCFMGWQSCLLDQPIKLPGAGNGIGHGVKLIDNDRGRWICGPNHRGNQVGGGFQGEPDETGQPSDNDIGSGKENAQLR